MGQQEVAAGVDKTIAYSQQKIAKSLIFLGLRVMDDVHGPSPADTKLDRGRVRMGLGKGLGVLLSRVTVSFLSKDAFGHNDGNRAVIEGYFG
jgi:hypothetical protein